MPSDGGRGVAPNDMTGHIKLVLAKFIWETGERQAKPARQYAAITEDAQFADRAFQDKEARKLCAQLRVAAMNAFQRTEELEAAVGTLAFVGRDGRRGASNPEDRESVFIAPQHAALGATASPTRLTVMQECLPHTGMPWMLACMAEYGDHLCTPIAWILSAATLAATWRRLMAHIRNCPAVESATQRGPLRVHVPAYKQAVSAVVAAKFSPCIDLVSAAHVARLEGDTGAADSMMSMLQTVAGETGEVADELLGTEGIPAGHTSRLQELRAAAMNTEGITISWATKGPPKMAQQLTPCAWAPLKVRHNGFVSEQPFLRDVPDQR